MEETVANRIVFVPYSVGLLVQSFFNFSWVSLYKMYVIGLFRMYKMQRLNVV